MQLRNPAESLSGSFQRRDFRIARHWDSLVDVVKGVGEVDLVDQDVGPAVAPVFGVLY